MSGIIVWLTLAATLAGPPAQAAAPATQPAVQAEVGRLIEQLGSTDFKVRTAALERLKAIGMPAYDQLKAAAENSSDAEVAANCEDLLEVLAPLVAAERLARVHPHLAGAFRRAAVSNPRFVLGMAGTVEQQKLVMLCLISLRPAGDALAIGHQWATGSDSEEIRQLATYYYVSTGLGNAPGAAFLQENAGAGRKMMAIIFSDRWCPRRRRHDSKRVMAAVFKLKGSIPSFVRMLARLRRKAKMTYEQLDVLAQWIAATPSAPASAKPLLVTALMPFLDDTRTLLIPGRIVVMERRDSRFQIADIALLALSRLVGGKWTTFDKETRYNTNAGYLFKSDAGRRKYITAFRTWYGKHRDQFAPDPATRPATQPAAGP